MDYDKVVYKRKCVSESNNPLLCLCVLSPLLSLYNCVIPFICFYSIDVYKYVGAVCKSFICAVYACESMRQ